MMILYNHSFCINKCHIASYHNDTCYTNKITAHAGCSDTAKWAMHNNILQGLHPRRGCKPDPMQGIPHDTDLIITVLHVDTFHIDNMTVCAGAQTPPNRLRTTTTFGACTSEGDASLTPLEPVLEEGREATFTLLLAGDVVWHIPLSSHPCVCRCSDATQWSALNNIVWGSYARRGCQPDPHARACTGAGSRSHSHAPAGWCCGAAHVYHQHSAWTHSC